MNNSLIRASMNGRLNNVRRFIQGGANVNSRNNRGMSPLMTAAFWGHLQVVHELIRAGANVNARNNDGWTALMYAILEDQLQIARELIRAGANVNARNNDGDTALTGAARRGRTQIVRELLKAGAKNWRTAHNRTNNQEVLNVIKNHASKIITRGIRTAATRRRVAAKKIQTAVYKYLYHPNRVQRPNTIVGAGKSRFNTAVRTAKIQTVVRKYLYNKNRVTKKYSTPR